MGEYLTHLHSVWSYSVAFLFLLSAVVKANRFRAFSQSLESYGFAPPTRAPFAMGLLALELSLSIALLVGFLSLLASILAIGCLAIYSAALLLRQVRRSGEDQDCGCFGDAILLPRRPNQHVALNITLASLGLVVVTLGDASDWATRSLETMVLGAGIGLAAILIGARLSEHQVAIRSYDLQGRLLSVDEGVLSYSRRNALRVGLRALAAVGLTSVLTNASRTEAGVTCTGCPTWCTEWFYWGCGEDPWCNTPTIPDGIWLRYCYQWCYDVPGEEYQVFCYYQVTQTCNFCPS